MGRRDTTPCEYECEVKVESGDAILVAIDGETDEDEWIWFPKSELIRPGTQVLGRGDEGTVVVPQWLAEDRGLE